ncbi:MAG: hypothetical protein RLZZ200_980 [Pseudomonadota bacterium]
MTTNDAFETAAHLLETSDDYRVLRRLRPVDDFGGVPTGPLERAIALDVETTGMDLADDDVIELGLVAFDYDPVTGVIFRIAGVYDSLEDPGRPIPPESTAIHGITDAMVAGQGIDDQAVERFVAGAKWVVAHNAGFDRPFVERRLPLFASLPWVCSLNEVPWAREGFEGRKLQYIANRFGLFYDGHRSEIDCRALVDVLRRPLPVSGGTGWRQLLASGAQSSYRIWALNSPFDTKDLLKARGYRWDAGRRCWNRSFDRDGAVAEAPWLKEQVYAGSSREVEIEIQDALTRYSTRPGRVVKRHL